MNDETPSFQINDVVTWTTYRNGGTQHHIGKIFAIIPSFVKAFDFKEGDSHYTLPDGQYVSIFKTEYDYRNVLPRKEVSYIVSVDNGRSYYWPRVERLQRFVDKKIGSFKKGSMVAWDEQIEWGDRERIGKVIAVIPPHTAPFNLQDLEINNDRFRRLVATVPDGRNFSPERLEHLTGSPQAIESYLIWVRVNERFYWPNAALLRPAEPRQYVLRDDFGGFFGKDGQTSNKIDNAKMFYFDEALKTLDKMPQKIFWSVFKTKIGIQLDSKVFSPDTFD